MASDNISTITKRVRLALGLTQQELAGRLGLKSGNTSIGNWEQDRKRPSPRHLKKMAEMAPAFAAEIARLVESYEWHHRHGTAARPEVKGLANHLTEGQWEAVKDLAKKERKTVAQFCAELIESGLNAKVGEMAEKVGAGASSRSRRSKAS